MLGTRCMSLLGFRVVAKVSGSSNTLNISPAFGRLRFEWQTRAYSCNAVLEFCTNNHTSMKVLYNGAGATHTTPGSLITYSQCNLP